MGKKAEVYLCLLLWQIQSWKLLLYSVSLVYFSSVWVDTRFSCLALNLYVVCWFSVTTHHFSSASFRNTKATGVQWSIVILSWKRKTAVVVSLLSVFFFFSFTFAFFKKLFWIYNCCIPWLVEFKLSHPTVCNGKENKPRILSERHLHVVNHFTALVVCISGLLGCTWSELS